MTKTWPHVCVCFFFLNKPFFRVPPLDLTVENVIKPKAEAVSAQGAGEITPYARKTRAARIPSRHLQRRHSHQRHIWHIPKAKGRLVHQRAGVRSAHVHTSTHGRAVSSRLATSLQTPLRHTRSATSSSPPSEWLPCDTQSSFQSAERPTCCDDRQVLDSDVILVLWTSQLVVTAKLTKRQNLILENYVTNSGHSRSLTSFSFCLLIPPFF